MSAMVKLDSGIVYGTVSTLLDGCVHNVVNNWKDNLDQIAGLPASLKDKCIYLMCKRGSLCDDNIAKLVHDKVRVMDLADCEVSDRGLAAICRCPQLKKIDLNSNKQSRTNISSTAIEQIARSCRQLQTVYLRRCVNLTDSAIITLSQCCPQVRLLNIGGCQHITDASLQALGENCNFLKSVNVSNSQVTDSGIIQLVSGQCAKTLTTLMRQLLQELSHLGLHYLQEVHINGCRHVTDEAVEAVLQFCPQIAILLFHGCPKITEQSRQALEDLTISRDSPMKQVTWTIY